MNKFKNTYINITGKSQTEILTIAEKYSEVSGLPLESYLEEYFENSLTWSYIGTVWSYIGTVRTTGPEDGDPEECISVTDRVMDFEQINMTEITEEDLDNYLNSTITPTTKYVEDWDDLEVGQKAIFRGFRNGHEHWKFTVGEVYTVGVDKFGRIGFISGSGIVPLQNYENTFMFELIDDEPFGKITSDYPDYDFKISLKGMSDVEKKLAKEWLVGVVKYRNNGNTYNIGNLERGTDFFGVITEEVYSKHAYSYDEDFFYNYWKLPEIKLEFSTPTITGFSVDTSKKGVAIRRGACYNTFTA